MSKTRTKSRAFALQLAQYFFESGSFDALGGDSGSLVVTEDGKYAVGLLFAAVLDGGYGYIIPIERILQELKMSLVGGHGI